MTIVLLLEIILSSDFKELHDLDPRHAGILAVYPDNDASRDMSNADIGRGIRNLEEAMQGAALQFTEDSTPSTIGDTERVSRRYCQGRKRGSSQQRLPTPLIFFDPFDFLSRSQ